jgi:hypothetical protein
VTGEDGGEEGGVQLCARDIKEEEEEDSVTFEVHYIVFN